MTPAAFLARVLDPGLALLAECGGPPVTRQARVILLAIAGQESAWSARLQRGGPARGYWQFEGGPVSGTAQVVTHPATKAPLGRVCAVLDIPFEQPMLYQAAAWCDPLAAAMARLLLYSDPRPMPMTEDAAWDCYSLRTWRPGKPHRAIWSDRWRAAQETVAA